MYRRLALASLALLLFASASLAQSSTRPNIVVIMIDDEDVASLNMLVARGLMPNLKKHLLDKGYEFTESFSTTVYGAPAPASFLTGQYPHNHREIGTSPIFGGVPKFNEASTVATWLQRAGYRTGLAGRYITGYGVHTSPTSIPPGWTTWAGLVEYDGWATDLYKINLNGTVVDFGALARQAGIALYQTDVLAWLAGEFIRTSPAGQPFFLWVTPVAFNREIWPGPSVYNVCPDETAPLYPYLGGEWWSVSQRPPARYWDSIYGNPTFPLPQPPSFNEEDVSDKPAWLQRMAQMPPAQVDCIQKRYWRRLEVMRGVDDLVGYIMQMLESTNTLENTVIIFAGDNGLLDGQHRFPEKLPAYEDGIRVPLVIRTRTSSQPTRISRTVLTMDLAPTIAQFAGVTPGHAVDGRSLVALMENADGPWRRMFLFEHGPGYTGTPIPGYSPPPDYFALRTDLTAPRLFLQYVAVAEGVAGEYYDMAVDPFQLQNLFARSDRQTEISTLKQWLAAMRSCGGGFCQVLEDYFSVPR